MHPNSNFQLITESTETQFNKNYLMVLTELSQSIVEGQKVENVM